jgi:hypothetical protein
MAAKFAALAAVILAFGAGSAAQAQSVMPDGERLPDLPTGVVAVHLILGIGGGMFVGIGGGLLLSFWLIGRYVAWVDGAPDRAMAAKMRREKRAVRHTPDDDGTFGIAVFAMTILIVIVGIGGLSALTLR